MKLITILLLLLLLTGCKLWEDIKNLQFVKPETAIPKNNSVNQTNETTNVTIEEIKTRYNESYPNIFIPSVNSILIIENNKSYVIDTPKDNPSIINLMNEFNVRELEFAVATIDKEEHNGGLPYVVVKAPPKILYDNGIENEYREDYIYKLDRYNKYWNRTSTEYITVLNDFEDNDFEFFVPYSKGLSAVKEENSIVVSYKGQFLYMSDCYNDCENKVPPIGTTFFVLANNGNCPTNSFDFVLSTGAKYVIGDEICQELKEELDFIGIKQIKFDKTIQILLKGDENEIRFG